MAKRTLDTFFKPISSPSKKPKRDPISTPSTAHPNHSQISHQDQNQHPNPPPEPQTQDTHPSYPIPIPHLPVHISTNLTHGTPARPGKTITNQPELDLLTFQPFITRTSANELFKFLRSELPFYRVQYKIKRFGVETQINTPRFTTVFGVDETARFIPRSEVRTGSGATVNQSSVTGSRSGAGGSNVPPPHPPLPLQEQEQEAQNQTKDLLLVHSTTHAPNTTKYQYTPRPIPGCLRELQKSIEAATGTSYNFCLVNYYASGEDSISFHSDDERFLGTEPNIASLSLGGEREFVMKHKPIQAQSQPQSQSSTTATSTATSKSPALGGKGTSSVPQIKMPLSSGDMVVMRGSTQSNWLHSIPKRRGKSAERIQGRINITFRKAMIPGGTNNYYNYNVGSGGLYRWDESRGEMVLQSAESRA